MSRVRGQLAEDRALRFLEQQGLKLVLRNYACRFGEIDLVMSEGEQLVFVEVRSRRYNSYGGAAASVGLAKQHKLWRTAEHYLLSIRRQPVCRFDLVAIDGPALSWLRDVISR